MIDMAVMMENEEVKAKAKQIEAHMDGDSVISKMLDAAENVADMYEIAKKYLEIKMEDFEMLFNGAMDYFSEKKTKLSDETMECIVGGRKHFNWKLLKKIAIVAAIAVGTVALCAGIGAVVGAGASAAGVAIAHVAGYAAATTVGSGALTGAITGAIGGTVAGLHGFAQGAKG